VIFRRALVHSIDYKEDLVLRIFQDNVKNICKFLLLRLTTTVAISFPSLTRELESVRGMSCRSIDLAILYTFCVLSLLNWKYQ